MSENDLIDIVTLGIVPAGLILIMFALGLSLSPADFARLRANRRAVAMGMVGQLALMPALALAVVSLFGLTAGLATGLFILAASPAGVTSNAMTHIGRGNVALAVTLTILTSATCVFTTPLYISWALQHFYVPGEAPQLSIVNTALTLVKMTVLPIGLGMAVRHYFRTLAERISRWSRPAALIVLVSVIGVELIVSWDAVARNVLKVGPAVMTLNVCAMVAGLLLARTAGTDKRDALTIGLEVGIHNATMAMYLSLTVLKSVDLAITAIIYGILMTFNATLFIRIVRRWGYPGTPELPIGQVATNPPAEDRT